MLVEVPNVLFELRSELFTQFRLDVLLIIWSGHIESPLSGSHVKTGLWRRFNIVNSRSTGEDAVDLDCGGKVLRDAAFV